MKNLARTRKFLMERGMMFVVVAVEISLAFPHMACGGEFWHGNGDGYWETNSGTGDNWETGSSNGYFFNKTAYGTKTVKFKSKVSAGSQVSIEGTNCTTDEDPIVFLADADEYGFTTTSNIRAGDYKLGNLWIKRGTFQCAILTAGNANNTGSLPLKIGGGDGKATVTATSDVKINKGTVLVATNGTLVNTAYLCVGKTGNLHGSLQIEGGEVTNTTSAYLTIADVANSTGTTTVRNGGKYYNISSADIGTVVGMRGNGTLDISSGGEVHLMHSLRFCYYSGSSATVRITDGGLLTMPYLYNGANGTANMTVDGGTIRAYEDNAAFIPATANIHVYFGANGATIDTAGHDITIAAALSDASGETGKATFTGDGGTVRLTGAANYTGMTYLNEKTHLVVANNTIKNAILSHGFTVTKPQGSAKGTYTVLSVAEGACTDADLASVTLGEGLEGATKSIVDGAVVITVSHLPQTWTGAAETSLPWSGANWTPGGMFDTGNDALFATSGAIASLDADDSAFTLTFSEDTTIAAGGGTLTVPSITVASGVTAAINAPTAGAMTKTGAGTLTLGANRADQTTVTEGTLVMANGATVSAANLTLGADPATPVSFDYGGGTLAAAPVSLMAPGCDVTLKNGAFGVANQAFALKTGTLRFGTGTTLAPATSFTLANAANATATVYKASGDWTFSGTFDLANSAGANATFHHGGGTMVLSTYSSVGKDSGGHTGIGHLVIDGGMVTNTATYIEVGCDSPGVMTVKSGGRHVNIRPDSIAFLLSNRTGGTGTLNVEGGDVLIGGPFHMCYRTVSGAAAANVTDGGVLTFGSLVYNSANGGRNASAATVTVDDGTIRAFSDSESFIPNYAMLTFTIGAGGGTLDTNGKAVKIAKQLTGTGAMTYKGGGRATFSTMPAYSGKTTVEVGTSLVVPSAIAGANLAFAIPDGLAQGVYEVVTISGSGTFASDVLSSATLPSDPEARFILSDDGKRIYCAYGSGINEQVWIGGASGNLNVAANWLSGSVPTSGAAIIGSASPATLTNPAGSVFAPASITFSANSAAVVLGAADGEVLTGIVTVTNLSSTSHTINVPVHFAGDIQVKQEAMAEIDDLAKAHVTFAGGAYAAQGHALENGNSVAVYSRCIFGAYHLYPPVNSPWAAVCKGNRNRICVADNSALNVQYAGMLTEIYVGNSAKVNVGSTSISTSGHRMSYRNYGEMVVTNLTVTATGDKFTTFNQGTSVPAVFKFESITNAMTLNWFYLGDGYAASKGVFYIGAGGLNFSSSSAAGSYCIGNNFAGDAQTVRPWYSDFTIGDRGNGNYGLVVARSVTFCTDDEIGVGRTITIDAITRATATPVVTVSGSGTLRVNRAANNNVQPSVAVTDTATLAIKPGASLGTGATTVESGAALQVAESGTVVLGGNLTLADGAVLGFNFTDKTEPKLDVTGKTVTFGDQSNLVVKVTATEGKRAKGGANVLTSGGKFANANVTLAEGHPDWVKGISVVDGNIVLEAKPTGLVVIIR